MFVEVKPDLPKTNKGTKNQYKTINLILNGKNNNNNNSKNPSKGFDIKNGKRSFVSFEFIKPLLFKGKR